MNNPLISIIIPVYNAADSIEKCVNSVVSQLSNEDELLLINDGSTDESIKVLRRLESEYKCIRVIDKENEGVCKTRNLGIKESKGKYICFMDNDDYVDNDYIQTYYNEIERTKADIVMGGFRRTDDNGIMYSVKGVNKPWYKVKTVTPWAKIYRRDFLIDNHIEYLDYPIGEDILFNFQAYNKTDKIEIIEYTGYNWYFNNQSVSNTVHKGFDERVQMEAFLDECFGITGKTPVYDLFYAKFVIWYLLFSGRGATKERFLSEYSKLRNWLKNKDIPYRFPLFEKLTDGEELKIKLIVWFFIIISRLKLVGAFATVYCKGKEEK